MGESEVRPRHTAIGEFDSVNIARSIGPGNRSGAEIVMSRSDAAIPWLHCEKDTAQGDCHGCCRTLAISTGGISVQIVTINITSQISVPRS